MDFVSAGQLFGELGMFSGTGYPFSATALAAGEAIAFDCFQFNRFMYAKPGMTWTMLGSLSR
ncbi:MAG: Crp/Fnr family transcriptional regulator [Chromatiales bacterium]|nr:Crp/Fnr family transcriptional regulator [Chromatiales bacterium]